MEFYGVNACFLEQYIAFKRNMGYALKDIYKFKMFDRFTIENGATTVGLTKELADKWAEKRPNESMLQDINGSMRLSIFPFT